MPAVAYPPAERTGEPVPAPGRSCYMDRIHSATPGLWNGEPVTLDDMRAMADNFQKYSTGDNPHYQPFVLLNHDDTLNSGLVTKAEFDGEQLHLSGDHIPEAVGSWANGKQLHGASIEYWKPEFDEHGNCVGTFMTPEGTYATTPVIRSLSLLGNQAPGMKGMSELPTARFSDSCGTKKYDDVDMPDNLGSTDSSTQIYSEVSTMDRASLVQALVAAGFDQSKITDDVPDAFLQYLVNAKATVSADTTGTGDPGEGQNNPVPMADQESNVPDPNMNRPEPGKVVMADTTIPAMPSVSGGGQLPTSMTLKFNDATGKAQTIVASYPPELRAALALQQQQVNQIKTYGATVAAALATERKRAKEQAIAAFGDRLATAKVPPVTIAAQKAVLNALDHTTTRKFADGKNSGTQLEEAMRLLEAAAVPGKNFNEKLGQVQPGKVDATGASAPGGTGTNGNWDARRQAMLSADPIYAKAQRDQAKKKAGAA